MARLDAIVAAMESGEIGLEESLAGYEEATQLAARCRQILDETELRIQKIQVEAGRIRMTPFAEAAEPESEEADEES